MFPPVIYYRAKDQLYRLKLAFQRARRGYDDSMLWDLNDAIADLAIPCLKAMIDHGVGCPLDLTLGKWKKILKTILEGFEAYKKAYNLEFGDSAFDTKSFEKEWKKLEKKWKKGLSLMAEWYPSLWD